MLFYFYRAERGDKRAAGQKTRAVNQSELSLASHPGPVGQDDLPQCVLRDLPWSLSRRRKKCALLENGWKSAELKAGSCLGVAAGWRRNYESADGTHPSELPL